MKLSKNITQMTLAGLLTLSVSAMSAFAEVNITGAGATFPAPVYGKWAADYYEKTGNKINYQGIGSSGGVKQITAKTVNFGASDAPLKDEQLKEKQLFQFPTVIGGVVLAVNVEGIQSNELVLDGQMVGDIYLGKITKWNDPAIVKLNPNLKLPDQSIAVVRRADGSGTSFVFTSYLAKVNPIWKTTIGSGSTVTWPVGVGGKGNDGVAAFVQRLSGSIGYVEYAYAKQNNLAYTKLVSASGEVVSPSAQSFSDAALGAKWQETFAQDLTNQAVKNAWPISSATFVLLHTTQENAENGKEILNFFDWAYTEAGQLAKDLDYATLPDSVTALIRNAWKENIKDASGNALYSK